MRFLSVRLYAEMVSTRQGCVQEGAQRASDRASLSVRAFDWLVRLSTPSSYGTDCGVPTSAEISKTHQRWPLLSERGSLL